MSKESTKTFYKLPYDKVIDKDIEKWLSEIDPQRKGDVVRHALRYYIAEAGEGEYFKQPHSNKASLNNETPRDNVLKEVPKERKRPNIGINKIKGNSNQ
ncbi:hypothetical protein [Bacillus sp. Marseille-P3800]|uniref:hypothetical protein n=1 Tax=Bacillus sp. Marseille-P3800 TaxID=2014782 RepID=UPI000C08D804|nr:hypothetical protein [Bacillus sp. Marseille-P3800]